MRHFSTASDEFRACSSDKSSRRIFFARIVEDNDRPSDGYVHPAGADVKSICRVVERCLCAVPRDHQRGKSANESIGCAQEFIENEG